MGGGVCPAARALAEEMARAYLAACGGEDECGAEVFVPLVQMLMPAAELVTETRALAEQISARLDVQAEMLAAQVAEDADRAGELDAPPVLADEYGYAGVDARKEAPGHG